MKFGVRFLIGFGLLLASGDLSAQVVVPLESSTAPTRFARTNDPSQVAWFGGGVVRELRGGRFHELTRCEGVVRDIRRIGDRTWILSAQGAHAAPVTMIGGPPLDLPETRLIDIAEHGNDVWLGTPTGAWRLRDGTATRIPDRDLRVNAIRVFDDAIWMGTSRGVFRTTGDTAESMTADVFVSDLHVTNGHVWASTPESLIRIGADRQTKAFGSTNGVPAVFDLDEDVWVGHSGTVHRVDGDRLSRVRGVEGRLLGVVPHDGSIAIVTTEGVWIGREPKPRRLLQATVTCHASWPGSPLMIGTDDGMFSIEGDTLLRITGSALVPTDLMAADGTTWVASKDGIGQVRLDGKITAAVDVDRGPWLKAVSMATGEAVWSSEEIMVRFGHSIEGIDGGFHAIVATNPSDLEQAVRQNRFHPGPITVADLPAGETTLFVAVRDRAGNVRRLTIEGKVVGTFPAFLAIVIAAWLSFVMATLAFASKNAFCHGVLMNRWLRNVGSLGLIPLMLQNRRVRNHTIAPYLKALQNDRYIKGALQYAVPSSDFQPDALMDAAATRGPTVIVGELGSGKTALLRSLYARAIRHTNTGTAVPVLIALGLSEGGFRQAFYDQLARLGGITDPALCRTLLRRHRFLIVVDGWDRLDASERELAREFLQTNARNSLVIIGTDPSMVPEGFHRLNLPMADAALSRKILCTKVRPDQVDRAIRVLETATDLALPQHLEVLGAVTEADALPDALDVRTLYAAHVEPALAQWAGYPWVDQLRADAAKGLLDGDMEGFGAIARLDDNAREHLERAGWVQGRRLRHPVIGSYLAATWFARHWDTQPTLPWHCAAMPSLLRFIILELEASGREDALRALVLEAMERTQKVGEGLMLWMTTHRPDLREAVFGVPA